jgi:NDP-sugar pyrophosphorylase family protein
MKALLICPSEWPGVRQLSENAPLVTVPLLGCSLLEYWLSHLALQGVSRVMVLAHDRPEYVKAVCGDGSRWGLAVEVMEESRELSPAMAMLKYAPDLDPAPNPGTITVLDHFPGAPERPLFTNYEALVDALLHWMPKAITPDRVGMREIKPGLWLGTHSQIASTAHLNPPCWIGEKVFVGAGAIIGPGAIVEGGAFIEPGAEVLHSCVGPDTFVGRLARLNNSLVLGQVLVHLPTSSTTVVPDPFLLCALRQPRPLRGASWLGRAAELYERNKEDVVLLWKHLLLRKES